MKWPAHRPAIVLNEDDTALTLHKYQPRNGDLVAEFEGKEWAKGHLP